MGVRTQNDMIRLADVTKLVNYRKVVRTFRMFKIKDILQNGKNMKTTKRRVDISRYQLFALKDGNDYLNGQDK